MQATSAYSSSLFYDGDNDDHTAYMPAPKKAAPILWEEVIAILQSTHTGRRKNRFCRKTILRLITL